MIELTVLNYLKSVLDVPVVMEKPTGNVDEFVLIEKTGSRVDNYCINRATFALQSWSTSLYNAASLNEDVKQAMDKIIESTDVSKSQLNSDYNFTDTTTKSYRYQAVYDLVF